MSKQADILLTSLAIQLLDAKLSLPVTLAIKGMIVTGSIISFDDYMLGICSEFESGGSLDAMVGEGIRAALEAVRNSNNEPQLSEFDQESVEGSDLSVERRECIHLKDAKIFVGNNLIPTNRGVFWRGSLDEVDGFAFGNLLGDALQI